VHLQKKVYVGSNQREIIGRRWSNRSKECDPDEEKVHKCDEHGNVDRVLCSRSSGEVLNPATRKQSVVALLAVNVWIENILVKLGICLFNVDL